jgi:hypothetical protein
LRYVICFNLFSNSCSVHGFVNSFGKLFLPDEKCCSNIQPVRYIRDSVRRPISLSLPISGPWFCHGIKVRKWLGLVRTHYATSRYLVEPGLTNVQVMALSSACFFAFLISLPYISLYLTLKKLKISTNCTARILNSFLFKDSLSIPLYLQCRPTESQRE